MNFEHRRKVFGYAHKSEDPSTYYADDTSLCPIFVNLEQPGVQSWKLEESKGKVTGGSFKIVIADQDLGHTWEHANTGVVIHGLPGIHQVLNAQESSYVGWGYLAHDPDVEEGNYLGFMREDTTFFMTDENNGLIKSTIDALEGAEFKLLWIGQECIAVTGYSGNTISEVTVANSGGARGLFRSLEQKHLLERWTSTQSVITDTPTSIVDKPATLWAFVFDEDGDLIGDPVVERWGKVGTDITTHKGKTTVSVLSPLSCLDNIVFPTTTTAPLAKYVFTRNGAGTKTPTYADEGSIWPYGQCPHLVIKEFDSNDSEDCVDHAIWLCEQDSAVEFDTIQELYDALRTELGRLQADGQYDPFNALQKSGDGAAGTDNEMVWIDDSKHTYSIDIDGSDGTNLQMWQTWDSSSRRPSLISGPLAWLFNLAPIHCGYERAKSELQESPCPWFFYAKDVLRQNGKDNDATIDHTWDQYPWMIPEPDMAEDADEWKDPHFTIENVFGPGNTYGEQTTRGGWVTKYYYSFNFETDDSISSYKRMLADDEYFRFVTSYKHIWIQPGVDTPGISAGDTITLGSVDDKRRPQRYLKATASAITDPTASEPCRKITIDNTLLKAETADPCMYYGAGLFYIPSQELQKHFYQVVGQLSDVDKRTVNEGDPWAIRPRVEAYGETISAVVQGILGDTTQTGFDSFSEELMLTHIPGFRDIDRDSGEYDWRAMFNYDQWDDVTSTLGDIVSDHQYVLYAGANLNLYDIVVNELLLHGAMPTYEWNESKGLYQIGARLIGPPSATAAVWDGRTWLEADTKAGAVAIENHNIGRLYNALNVQCKYIDDKFFFTMPVNYQSGHAINQTDAKTLSIKAKMTRFPYWDELTEEEKAGLIAFYTNLLIRLSNPMPVITLPTSISMACRAAIGREVALTDRSGRVPYTHELGLSEHAAMVTAMSIDYSRGGAMKLSARVGTTQDYGWVPSCKITAFTKAGSNTINVTASTAHEFSATDERVDCMWFGCQDWNVSTNTYSRRHTTCSDFPVLIFEHGAQAYTSGTNLLISGTVDQDSVSSDGTFSVTFSTGAEYTAIDTAKDYIMTYAKYDDVESCQRPFIYFADKSNRIGTASVLARRWL
ncbi:MAG: hypothetical protein GY854_19900 [Deltaproteobacteria bacterium]|nr:hypothetical protein [Deltaproteobacteria bacterium]